MKRTGGAIVTRALEDEGIELAFGIPGTHNIELYDALAESDRVRTVLVTDEQSASFMADAAWRASGRMACVNVVPGAGLTHAMSGIAEAFMDNVPMLVLGCGIRRDVRRAYQLHDVDQEAMVRPVVKATYRPQSGAELYSMIREACCVARSGAPGPVFVEVSVELYLFKHEIQTFDDGAGGESEGDGRADDGSSGDGSSGDGSSDDGRGGDGSSGGRSVGDRSASDRVAGPRNHRAPDPALIKGALALIAGAKRPLLYVGAGVAGATEPLRLLAEALDAPVSTTFQGKGVFPEDHPLFLWPGFGRTAPAFVQRIAERSDLTIAIGCRFSEVGTGSYALEPHGKLIHIDIDEDVLGRNFTADVGIPADSGLAIDAILDGLGGARREVDELRRVEIADGHAEVWEDWLDDVGGDRVSPVHLMKSAQAIFGPETIYTTDSGNGTFLAMEHLRLAEPGRFLAPVDYSCMGYAVPAALGAKLACPERPVVSFAGDGAFLMTGLELVTAAQEGIGVVILVLRDGELAQIAQFQSTAMNRKTASRVHGYDLEGLAAGMRAAFLRIDKDEDVESVLREAWAIQAEGRPVLVDVAIDYSRKTYFTRGVIQANLGRLPLRDRMRFVGRAIARRFTE